MRKRLEEAYGQMDKLRENIELLTTANVTGQKENYRNELALAESIYEIQNLQKKNGKSFTGIKKCCNRNRRNSN